MLNLNKFKDLTMFERKLKQEYLKLAQIIYGGEFYLELKNYKLKEVKNTKFEKVIDTLLSKQGNNKFYAYKNHETGFAGNVFDNGKNLVIAFRGTERLGLGENVSDLNAFLKDVYVDINLMTGNFDKQFKDAWEFFKEVKKENPKRKIVITGQSLGGALSQIVAAKEYTINRQKIETHTFNAPGCSHLLETYDCNLDYNYSFITNYSVMNDWCGMFGEHIGNRYLIKPITIPANKTNKTSEIMNNILLKTHEGIFDYTEEKNGRVIKKPKDFNQKEGLSLWYFDKNNLINKYPNVNEFVKQNVLLFNFPDVTQNSFMQKTQKFFEENIPDKVQNSSAAVAIKSAADNIIANSNEQIEKITEKISNTALSTAIRILDSIFAELSYTNLENANRILNKIVK